MKKKKISYAKYGYIFSLPFVITFCIFTLYPIIFTVILGFTDFKGLGNVTWHFLDNPFQNFEAILTAPTFKTALGNTFMIWGWNFLPQILLALLLAAIFTNVRNKVKGQGFFKVVFYMPNIITAATVAILFGALFGYPMGPMNDLFTTMGWSDAPIHFLQNKWIARGVVSFIQFWMWYGYTMIVLISGILGINPELYEAADIDGATTVQQFFYVTIPNLRTVLIYTLVTSLIGGLTMFDIPNLLVTKSGPNNATLTTSVFIYNQAFSGSYMYNRASAASIIMFVLISILSAIVFMLMQDKSEVAEKKELKRIEKEMKQAAKKGGTL
ncbi:MAG: sugar ABC transporter permease [Lachnospiraceae bacterium]|nr:sugar ABC transporter permease [Lachnospiraceae bacterium]